jgi:TRAP-type C4-dicarboxylate transport system substrate-binding protein
VQTLARATNFCWLAALAVCGCAPAQGPPTVRLASFSPSQGWTVSHVLVPWVAELNGSFAGAATLELFSGGSLGRHPDAQLRMITERVVDIAYVLPSYTPGEFLDNDLFEIPLLLPDAHAASLAAWRMLKRGELRGYSGLEVLALYTTNPYYLHLAKPIHSLAELRGKKIRVSGSLQARTVAALDAMPVGGIAASELADSIERGLLDGTLLPWDLMHIYGVTRVTAYHIEFPLGFSNLLLAMNRDTYASLPASVRRALDERSGEPLIERFVRANAQLAQIGYQAAVRSGGHEFVELVAADERDWRNRLAPLIEERKKRVPRTEAQLRALRDILAGIPAAQPVHAARGD